jgi:hypothetical protein
MLSLKSNGYVKLKFIETKQMCNAAYILKWKTILALIYIQEKRNLIFRLKKKK